MGFKRVHKVINHGIVTRIVGSEEIYTYAYKLEINIYREDVSYENGLLMRE